MIIISGTIVATKNEINSKFDKIIGIGPASMILFLTPTSQFILGITYFDEVLTLEKFFGFVIIWVAVSIYLNELRKE